jgi:hypothetical protein
MTPTLKPSSAAVEQSDKEIAHQAVCRGRGRPWRAGEEEERALRAHLHRRRGRATDATDAENEPARAVFLHVTEKRSGL